MRKRERDPPNKSGETPRARQIRKFRKDSRSENLGSVHCLPHRHRALASFHYDRKTAVLVSSGSSFFLDAFDVLDLVCSDVLSRF